MAHTMYSDDGAGPIVSAAWLLTSLGKPGVRVLDARPFDRYAQGHIPGAACSDQNVIRIPDSSPPSIARFDQLAGDEVRRLGLQPGDKVIFYEEISGCYAARGVWMLDYLGLPGSAILDGGLEAWLDAGGTLTREIPEFEPSETVTTPDRSLLATADEIVASLDTDGESCAVLDTRGDGEYLMATIPDAAHVDWTRTLDRSGRFLSVEELSSLYEAAGFDPNGENPVVTFCGSGYRAAHSYLVLKALGYPNVKNYVPSWSEWGRRPDLPKVRPNPV